MSCGTKLSLVAEINLQLLLQAKFNFPVTACILSIITTAGTFTGLKLVAAPKNESADYSEAFTLAP